MYVCVECRNEMRCIKNGVGQDYGHGHVYPADMFKCDMCGTRILATNLGPSFDPEYKFQEVYLPDKSLNETKGKDIRNTEYWDW